MEAATLPAAQHRALVDRWKVMAEMNLREQRVPQDGRIFVRYEKKEFDLRVSVLPTVTGERVTARILDKSGSLLDLDKLGMDANTLAAVKRMVERPHGYVVLAGMAASGKTTFAYALLRHLQAFGQGHLNILTVEDPVEYQIQGLSQTAVNRRAGLTYASCTAQYDALRPGRDLCGRNAKRGDRGVEHRGRCHRPSRHSRSLHVGSAIQTVQRLRDIGIVNHLLASNLVGAVGMRLVRRVCQDCATDYEPAARDLARAGLSLVEDGPFRRGAGCDKCRQTGLSGAYRAVRGVGSGRPRQNADRRESRSGYALVGDFRAARRLPVGRCAGQNTAGPGHGGRRVLGLVRLPAPSQRHEHRTQRVRHH